MNAGGITNTATGRGAPPSGSAVTAQSSVTTPAAQQPAIGMTKAASVTQFSELHTVVTYSYIVVNSGNLDLHAVTVIDPLPGLSTVSCPESVLAPSETETCTATYATTQADVDRGFVANAGTATGRPPSGPAVTHQSTVTIEATQSPAITLLKTASPSFFSHPGTTITYSHEVTNSGKPMLHRRRDRMPASATGARPHPR